MPEFLVWKSATAACRCLAKVVPVSLEPKVTWPAPSPEPPPLSSSPPHAARDGTAAMVPIAAAARSTLRRGTG